MSEVNTKVARMLLDEGGPRLAVVRRETPVPERKFSLSEVCREFKLDQTADEIRSAARAVIDAATGPPVVGVAGMMNSGKSSTVRLFLSQAGRERVPTGIDTFQGTQRFVFWLPTRWKQDAATWEMLRAQFAVEPECLEEDPSRAHAQYARSGGASDAEGWLGRPLVAFDPALDENGFGVVDFPDVQREHADLRLRFVRKAAVLLAGICFVVRLDGAADTRMVGQFRLIAEQTPGLPITVLANRASVNEMTRKAALALLRRQYGGVAPLERVFLSYGFDEIQARESTPARLHPLIDQRLPAYFRIDDEASEETLDAFFHALDPKRWHLAKTEGKRKAMGGAVRKAREAIRQQLESRNAVALNMRSRLLEICRDCSVDSSDNPRIQLAGPVARQISDAIKSAAPWWARPAIWTTNLADGIKDRLRFLQKRARTMSLNAAVLAERTWVSFGSPDPVNQKIWGERALHDQAWKQVLDRVKNHPISIPSHELKATAEKFWHEFERKHGWHAVGAVLLLLGLLAAIFVTGGFGAAVLGQASLVELGSLVGAGGLMATFQSSGFSGLLEERIFPAGFSNLFAFACDEFGLPREIPGKPVTITVNRSKGPAEMTIPPCPAPARSPAFELPVGGYWSEQAQGWDELEQLCEAHGNET